MEAAAALRLARSRSGLSLRGLATRAGTSHSTLAAYEAGSKVPSTATLDRLLRAAGFASDIQLSARARNGPNDRGEELAAVLNLAGEFPARHHLELRYPVFGR